MFDFVLDPLQLLVTLVLFHFLLDFAIQGDFVAQNKGRKLLNGNPNPNWYIILTAHSAAHALPVWILTNSYLGLSIVFITHFLIDFTKCEGKLTFLQDQMLHIIVLLVTVLILTSKYSF